MIRTAGLADSAVLTAIESECFDSDAWSGSLVDAELTAPTGCVLLASEEESALGYGSIRVVDDVADLQRIAILPGVRRQGLGRELLDHLLTRAATLGASRILLEVADTNASAVALYESSGFAVIHRRRAYYASGADALVMERSL